MTAVDTPVWVEFFRGLKRSAELTALLDDGEVIVHPWVLGELMLGHLGPRSAKVIEDLRRAQGMPVLEHEDLYRFIEAHRLTGAGIGWVDVQVLASTKLVGAALWTFDVTLRRVAGDAGVPVRDGS